MTPFSGDTVASANDLPTYDQAAAHARAQNDSEYDVAGCRSAIGRLRQGEAVGIVFEANFASQALREIPVERLAIENGRVGILEQSGTCGNGPGRCDADAARASKGQLGLIDQ